jgi:outer membrane receptor for ferrienterochelin and colicins
MVRGRAIWSAPGALAVLLAALVALTAATARGQAPEESSEESGAAVATGEPATGASEEPAPAADEALFAEDVSLDELLDEDEELEIPEVVVTGARMEEPADHAAVQTEVIRREEIEGSGARDAAELLEERAGLQVQRSFRGTELWLRGMDPEYTLVLVDGDRVPGRIGGAIDLSRYGVENIERVEIVRGPSSALYGSDAIGGVVNLITRDSEREFEADALASYGLGNVIDATARVAGRPDEHLRLRLDGGFHYADPFRQGDGDEDGDDGEEPVATDGSSRLQWSLGGRLDWRPDERHRIRVNADYIQRTLEGVDGGAGGAVFDRTQLQEQMRVSAEHRVTGPNGLRLLTRATYGQFREQYLNDQRGSNQLDDYEDNREHMGQITTLLRFNVEALGNHGITVGFEQLFQSLDSDRLSQFANRARFALLAQDQWIPWEDGEASLTIVPGLRYDVDSQFGDQLAPKLSVRFDPVEQLVLRASYGRGFRAPSFQQLLLRFENPTVGYVVSGNPDLGAETSHGVDVGFEWTPIDEVSLSASFFRNDVEDLIAVVTVDDLSATGTLLSYDNIASAWTMGLESTATLRVDDVLGVIAGYTLTETWDGESQRHLEGRARHRVTLATRLAYEPWEISFVARGALMLDRVFYVDTDRDGVEEALYPEPIAQVDLRLAKRFTRHLELFAGIDNLLDAGDAYTVLRPFTVYGGVRGRY